MSGDLFGAAPAKRQAVQHRCAICGASAGLGFSPPREFMPAPERTLWACAADREAVEARWRGVYGIAN